MINDYSVLFQDISKRKGRVVLIIEGMAAAGKSTLAAMLKESFSCGVITMDGFFLRPGQRTHERFAEPGGNIDYERFIAEVASPLSHGKSFAYRAYDCKAQKLSEPIKFVPSQMTVIEGVYSMHPKFASCWDNDAYIKVFLKISPQMQIDRLRERNPAQLSHFIDEWIPMENRYFEHFKVEQQCNYIYKQGM